MRPVIEDSVLTAIHARLAVVLQAPRTPYIPLTVGGQAIGWVDRVRAMRLARFADVLQEESGTLRFVRALSTEPARTAALDAVVRTLAGEGLLSAWRDETYAVAVTPTAAPAFMIERAAARYFGVLTQAAHVNGLVAHHGDVGMWLARRSRLKAIDPWQLDNLVGGGVRAGTSIEETLRREAWEEAGITASTVKRARPAGTVRICRAQPDGLQREIIYVHDLRLPGDFVPESIDGEAVAHRLVTLQEAAAAIAIAEGPDVVTADASLVVLDCLIRHGAIAPDVPLYLALAELRFPPLAPA